MSKCPHGKPIPGECQACEKMDAIHDRLRARVAELEAALAIAWDALDDAWTENCPEEVAIVRKALFPKP